jgi:hypothetical protein
MSLNFTQTIALIDRNVKTNLTSYTLADKTADINLALDYVLGVIFKADGTWQFDDSNHSDYPIITTNLIAGQRDYSFTTDETGNLILDIYKVLVMQPDGSYKEIKPVDAQSQDVQGFYNGLNQQGIPTQYDKTANGIFLDSIPSYSKDNGVKIYINRETTYFTTSDTTKKAGFAGIFHEFLALRPSYQYATRNSLPNYKVFEAQMLKMEDDIKKYYSKREKDVRKKLKPHIDSTR